MRSAQASTSSTMKSNCVSFHRTFDPHFASAIRYFISIYSTSSRGKEGVLTRLWTGKEKIFFSCQFHLCSTITHVRKIPSSGAPPFYSNRYLFWQMQCYAVKISQEGTNNKLEDKYNSMRTPASCCCWATKVLGVAWQPYGSHPFTHKDVHWWV